MQFVWEGIKGFNQSWSLLQVVKERKHGIQGDYVD